MLLVVKAPQPAPGALPPALPGQLPPAQAGAAPRAPEAVGRATKHANKHISDEWQQTYVRSDLCQESTEVRESTRVVLGNIPKKGVVRCSLDYWLS